MDSTPFAPSHHGAALFEIYSDPAAASRNISNWPSGACNFVDLRPGANGARCGCRRFWIRTITADTNPDGPGWCMCNHHACYHEDYGHEVQPVEANLVGNGQENERPRTGREPLSPVVDAPGPSLEMAPGFGFPSFGIDDALSFIYKPVEGSDHHPGRPTGTVQQPQASLPDTLPWGDCIQSSPDANGIPPVPSQCLMPSQTASTVSSAQTNYLRPFAGKGLDTLSGATRTRSHQLMQPPPGNQATNPTPPTPGRIEDSFVLIPSNQAGTATPRPSTAGTQVEPRAQDSQLVTQDLVRNLSDTVNGHEQRLERLEESSFTAGGHEECHERNENVDLRLTELESRMEDVEKTVGDTQSIVSRRGDGNDDCATQSLASFASTSTSRPTHSRDLFSQIESLQAQVTTLQAAIPTYSHPWEVEVVFLPFPLQKVWQNMSQFKTEPATAGEDWTQLPMTNSTMTLRAQSPSFGEWMPAEHDMDWLLPKACSDRSIVDKRLRSRGLIRKISVRSPDARSVHAAMYAAFGGVWREMKKPVPSRTDHQHSAAFAGLRSPWVPLRKIHKDSRLRFLDSGEMVSPALWDVQFLTSVMMRSSEPRLFITDPDAYLQDTFSYETGWTWQHIRELNRFYPADEGSQEVPEADAMEECWAWHEQLDDSPHVQQQPVSLPHVPQRRSTSSPSQQYFPARQSWRSSSPALGFGQSSVVKGRRASQPPHIRTASMPITAPENHSPMGRHRVVSGGYSRRSSPSVRVSSSQFAVMKRRRTRSPSHHFTPRWTASPSPMPPGLIDRHPARGTTPFAYATPHSNAPLQEVRPMRGDSEAPPIPLYIDEGALGSDVEIYKSSSEDEDGGSSIGAAQLVDHPLADSGHGSQRYPGPEDADIPWHGIEDREQLSDGENIDPEEAADMASNASSQPSEYPSTQRAWPNENEGDEFQIHEDDE